MTVLTSRRPMIRIQKLASVSLFALLLSCTPDSGSPMGDSGSGIAKKGKDIVLSLNTAVLSVSPHEGGRVNSLSLNGRELLFVGNANKSTVWGSVLWPSPQSEWNWPPIEELDSEPYSEKIEGNQVVLTSKTDPLTGYQITKRFFIDRQKHCFSLHYSITNHSSQTKTVAAWEVTRLNPKGAIFFPMGNAEFSSGLFYLIPVTKVEDIVWADYPANRHERNHSKLMTDGKEGWLAYIRDNTLFVKEFADAPVELITPNEGEIELFASVEGAYWEADQQGVGTKLNTGESLEWQVNWYLFDLSESTLDLKSPVALAKYVREKLGVAKGTSVQNTSAALRD